MEFVMKIKHLGHAPHPFESKVKLAHVQMYDIFALYFEHIFLDKSDETCHMFEDHSLLIRRE